jgi:titin
MGSSGSSVFGNYIGTNSSGTEAVPNQYGIYVASTEDLNIGGPDAGYGNLISGNALQGIRLSSTDTSFIQGNRIGTDVTGTLPLANATGTQILASSSENLVGGTEAGAGNLISGNGTGIFVDGEHTVIQGNYIGTDITGTTALGNGVGISVAQVNAITIGGAANGAGNVIAANQGHGIYVDYDTYGTFALTVRGNRIGVGVNGEALGNAGSGIWIKKIKYQTHFIGGTKPGEANIIAHNGGDGVSIHIGNNIAVVGNSVYDNEGLGIDLLGFEYSSEGVTPNDVGDLDNRSNLGQNYPELTTTEPIDSSSALIAGILHSQANRSYGLHSYANQYCDPSVYGEGQIYIGVSSITTDANGDGSFDINLAAEISQGYFITATATDPNGNTSEISHCSQFITQGTVGAPIALSADVMLKTAINLTWFDLADNETAFFVERSHDIEDWTQIGTTGADSTAYTDTGLQCDDTYRYRVRAYSADLNVYSTYSPVFEVTTAPCENEGNCFLVTTQEIVDNNICDESYCNLLTAIRAANAAGGGTIILPGGDYTLTTPYSFLDGASGLPSIETPIVIEGNGATIARSMTEGTPRFRIFYVQAAGELTLKDLHVENGYADGESWTGPKGGGVITLGSLIVEHVTFEHNESEEGGATLSTKVICP